MVRCRVGVLRSPEDDQRLAIPGLGLRTAELECVALLWGLGSWPAPHRGPCASHVAVITARL